MASRKKRRGKIGAALSGDIREFIRRFVVVRDSELTVLVFWVIHTYAMDVVSQTPYLAVTSPEKQCGKSRLLEILELLVNEPWPTVLPSEAIVYRRVAATQPTLLLDETDAIFNPRTADKHEGLRALLNAGHRRGAKVSRCLNGGGDLVEFSTFCPKVLAGIGTLPDTVTDRSVPIRMERKSRQEPVERFIRRDEESRAEKLRERIGEWVDAQLSSLAHARPVMPDELSDREQEGCEILVAIADAVGEGSSARRALIELLAVDRLDSVENMRIRLLRDIRAVFGNRKRGSTKGILRGLYEIEEAPWESYYQRGLEAKDLASLLKPYGIKSTTIRTKVDGSPAVRKGYKREQFEDVWSRYLSSESDDDA